MPRINQLPTPLSSTEIKPQDSGKYEGLQLSFELPPATLAEKDISDTSASSTGHQTSQVKNRDPQTSIGNRGVRGRELQRPGNKTSTPLPPPPTRSRRIIQMSPSKPPKSLATATSSSPAFGSNTNSEPNPNPAKASSTPAMRKVSRKTAHSLIERRRRGKMNDEFDVLKALIPACTEEGGGARDMHKLEILKASVEYIRYLKDCVSSLEGPDHHQEHVRIITIHGDEDGDEVMQGMNTDTPDPESSREHVVEEEEVPIDPQLKDYPSTSFNPPPTPKLSPALLPQRDRRQYSFSSASTFSPPLPQPRHGNEYHWYSGASTSSSTYTSPVLAPQAEQDQENGPAMALLMLNPGTSSGGNWQTQSGNRLSEDRGIDNMRTRRGLSVRDLLSS